MSKAITRIDASVLYRRLQYMGLASKGARHKATLEIGARLIRTMNAKAPRDTNRYVRAWVQAGNAAGVTSLIVPTVQKSGRHDQFVQALAEQAAYWKDQEAILTAAYERLYGYRDRTGTKSRRRQPGMTPGQRDMKRKMDRAARNYARSVQELDRVMKHADAVILIGLYASVDKGKGGGRSLTRTTRGTVYGGTGKVVETQNETFLYLHNREPHARIVERNTKILKKAQTEARALGLKTVNKTFKMAIVAAANK